MQKTDFIILLFCAIAAILHGMSGFGFPMLSTAAVAMLYPLSTAVALVLIPCLLLNIYMLRGDATAIYIQQFIWLLQKILGFNLQCADWQLFGRQFAAHSERRLFKIGNGRTDSTCTWPINFDNVLCKFLPH